MPTEIIRMSLGPFIMAPHTEELSQVTGHNSSGQTPNDNPDNEVIEIRSTGTLVVGAVTDTYDITVGGAFVTVDIRVTLDFIGDSSFDVLVNNALLGSVPLASGKLSNSASFAKKTKVGDTVRIRIAKLGYRFDASLIAVVHIGRQP